MTSSRPGYSYRSQQTCLVKLNSIYRILLFMVGICCGVLSFSLMRTLFAIRKDYYFAALSFSEKTGLDMDDFEMLQQDHSEHEVYHRGEGIVAERLSEAVRVLCLVLSTHPKEIRRLEAIKNTWGKRCNTLLFTSNFHNSSVPVIELYAGTDKFSKWALTKSAIKYVYTHNLSTHDWIFIAEERTFAVVENLRYLLSNYSSSDALYFGCWLKKSNKHIFMSGGAGYVLSREAVNRMVKTGLTKEICNRKDNGVFDIDMGNCMRKLDVKFVDTRDGLGRGRFFPFPPKYHLVPGVLADNSWYWNMTYFPPSMGLDCCSDTAITFYDIDAGRMYELNYLVYHLRPFGVNPHYPVELSPFNISSTI